MQKQLKLALILSLVSLNAWATEPARDPQSLGVVQVSTEEQRLRLALGVEYVRFAQNNLSIAGLAFTADFQYALTRKWALGGGIRQAFSSSGFSAFFTEIHASAARALTGSLLSIREQVSINGSPVSNTSEIPSGGWAARLYLAQYFVNTIGFSLPFNGLGAGLSYDWNWNAQTPVSVGARMDRMTNGTTSYYPLSIYAAFGLSL